MKSTAARARRWLSAVGLLALIAAGVAGCGGTDKAGSAPSASDSASTPATQSPTPTPPGAPEQFGPATLVNGRVSCRLYFGSVTTDGDGTGHSRDGRSECVFTMNDPRVTGESRDTWLVDKWVDEQDRTILVQWGDTVLDTTGGTWKGTYSGAYDSNEDFISYWFRGAGAYKGLTFHAWLTQPDTESNAQWASLVEGIIYPGEPPAVTETGH